MSRSTALRWALGLAMVAVLVVTLDGPALAERLREATMPLVIAGVAGLTALHVLGAATWRTLTRRLIGIHLGWGSAIRLYYAGQAVGSLTPANLGADAYRIGALRPVTGTRHASLPVAIQRATSYAAVAVLAGVALVGAWRADPGWGGIVAAALALGLAGTGLSVLFLRRSGRGERRAWQPAVFIGLALGLVFHALAIGFGWILVAAVDPAAASVQVLAAIAIARVTLLIPLTPGGLGFGEAAMVMLFAAIGLPVETALAAALLSRVALLLTVALGAAALGRSPRPLRMAAEGAAGE